MKRKYRRGLFFPAKNKRLANIISIRSPMSFRRAIKILRRGGLTATEKRALLLARNRARALLHRRHLSVKKRKQLRIISRIPIR